MRPSVSTRVDHEQRGDIVSEHVVATRAASGAPPPNATVAPADRLKPALRFVHRWIGLTLGVLFAIVGLSGSLLLFQPQMFRWAHGEMIPAQLSSSVGSVDRWLENARASAPGLAGPVAIWPPHTDHNVSNAGMLIFDNDEPGGLGKLGLVAVLVAPSGGEVLGVIDVDRSPAYAPLFLHSALWSGSVGAVVIGIMAVGCMMLLGIGFYLWWPRRGPVLRKLSPRPWRITLTYAMRLHEWAGVWIASLLLVLLMTGLYLVQPAWVEPALSVLSNSSFEHADDHSDCKQPITFDTAITRAKSLVPDGTWAAIEPHDDARGLWNIMMRTDAGQPAHQQTRVRADLPCGIVAIESTQRTRSARDATELWLGGLHDGSALGTGGRIFITFVGLGPLLLLWTGMRVWLRRRH
jgi:uncharacterized iron-regulated membrane protein